MVGYDLVLPGSCTGELKIRFIVGVFSPFLPKILAFLSISVFEVGTHPSGSVNIQFFAPSLRKKRMNFPHLLARREQLHVRAFRWADRREFSAGRGQNS